MARSAVALVLGVESRDLLLGSAAPPAIQREIRRVIESFPETTAINELLTMQLGRSIIPV